MSLKTLTALAFISAISAALTGPASAQYDRVHGPGYGPTYRYGPAYAPRIFRGARVYNQVLPFFYGDGWVPESIWDPSRVGSVDPTIRPSGN
jgi:hypothetical protein